MSTTRQLLDSFHTPEDLEKLVKQDPDFNTFIKSCSSLGYNKTKMDGHVLANEDGVLRARVTCQPGFFSNLKKTLYSISMGTTHDSHKSMTLYKDRIPNATVTQLHTDGYLTRRTENLSGPAAGKVTFESWDDEYFEATLQEPTNKLGR